MNNENKTFHYSVGELLAILQNLPQDLPVLISGYESGFENFYPPEIKALKYFPENKYYEGEFQLAEKNEKNTFQAIVLQRVIRDD